MGSSEFNCYLPNLSCNYDFCNSLISRLSTSEVSNRQRRTSHRARERANEKKRERNKQLKKRRRVRGNWREKRSRNSANSTSRIGKRKQGKLLRDQLRNRGISFLQRVALNNKKFYLFGSSILNVVLAASLFVRPSIRPCVCTFVKC